MTPNTLELVESQPTTADDQAAEIIEEVLIEEISIDGMCGVY